jgi:type II secretory pathway component PulK
MSSSNVCNRSGSSARITSRRRGARGPQDERGYALIAVVGIVGVLAVIAMALTERARIGASAASDFVEETRDLYAVQAGIATAERALAGKLDLGKEGQLRLELTWDERTLDILVTDQAKKIDVNRASVRQLAEGFAALGLAPEEAATLAARTIDWRDPDDRAQPRGAEAADYAAAGRFSIPRNDRFVSLDEVETVAGMPADIATRLLARFVVTRVLAPIAPDGTDVANLLGMDRKMPAVPSDGLTRTADAAAGTRGFDVEVVVRREGESVERASQSAARLGRSHSVSEIATNGHHRHRH